MRTRVALETAAAVAVLVALGAAILVAGQVLDWRIGNPLLLLRILAAVVLGSALMLCGLYAVLVWIGRTDHYSGRAISALYVPVLVMTACLALYFGLASIDGIDIFLHGGRRHWTLLREPEVQIAAQVIVIAMVVVGFGGFLAQVLRGRGSSWWTVLAVCGVIVAAVAALIAATVIWGQSV